MEIDIIGNVRKYLQVFIRALVKNIRTLIDM